jgi:hypothetical protein
MERVQVRLIYAGAAKKLFQNKSTDATFLPALIALAMPPQDRLAS